jgi:hypothetical protein
VPSYLDQSKDLVGWRISQLNSMFVDPGKILKLFRDPPNGNLAEVYNSKLGQAYIDAENRLSYAEVIALCGSDPIAESDKGPCFLGADVGRLIHCVIGKNNPEKGAQIVYAGSFPEWSRLNELMKKFNVVRGVIDALPETRLSRSFAAEHPGKAYICFYSEHQKGGLSWNEKEGVVTANRTESLDASHNLISGGKVLLPRESEVMREFASHGANIARVLQTDPETGASKYTYLKTGDDHYRHAFNYFAMAMQGGSSLLFAHLL